MAEGEKKHYHRLTDADKQYILSNMHQGSTKLAEEIGCTRQAVDRYIAKYKLLKQGIVVKSCESVNIEQTSCACAINGNATSKIASNLAQSCGDIVTPASLIEMTSKVIRESFEGFLAYNKKVKEGGDYNEVDKMKKYGEQYVKAATMASNWYGMNKEQVVNNNTVNYNRTDIAIATKEEIAEYEQYIRGKDPDAL